MTGRNKLNHLPMLVGIALMLGGSESPAQLAAGKGKFLGNVWGGFGTPPLNYDLYWNQITPENASKWVSVEGTRNSYNWTRVDEIYSYCIDTKGYPFKFHTLIWGQQYPTWLTGLDSLTQSQEIEEWIRLVGERYPSASFVDVVNEPLPGHNPAPFKNALGGDGATGWDWVIRSFQLARQYMLKGVKLLINEYGILGNSQATTNYLTIINLLKDRNLIDGIGIQGHRFELETADTTTIKNNLTALAATGLPIYISEFDVAPANQLNDATQLAEYQRIFPVLWRHPGVKGITFWGYIKDLTWQTNAYLITGTGTERPAMQWLKSFMSTVSDVADQPRQPADFTLSQNYPNPFNPATVIRYQLSVSSFVSLKVFDVLGREVDKLVEGVVDRGVKTVQWNAKAPSGIYIYRLEAVSLDDPALRFVDSKRMILLR
ncbi:MAG: endo-1,4-beta-xylanase [Bacteroidota bacterium]